MDMYSVIYYTITEYLSTKGGDTTRFTAGNWD